MRLSKGKPHHLFFGLLLLLRQTSPARAQEIVEYPTATAGSGPADIKLGPDGRLYFAELSANKIGRRDADGRTVDFPLPSSRCGPGSLAVEPNGNVWYTRGCPGGI